MSDQILEMMSRQIAERTAEIVMGTVEARLDNLFRDGVRVSFSEKEAAAHLQMSPRELARKRANREIGFYKNGRKISFGLQHLLDFLARSEVRASAPSRFELVSKVSPLGAEIRPTLRKVS